MRKRIQIDITEEMEQKIIKHANEKGMKKNEWVKFIIYKECEKENK